MTRVEFMLFLIVLFGTLFSIGAALGALIEHAPAYLRLIRRRLAARRARELRREILCDPWSGAVVKHRKYFTPHWNAAVGRAYRATLQEEK